MMGFTSRWSSKLSPVFEEGKMKRIIFFLVSAVFAFTALTGMAMGQGAAAKQPEEQVKEFISRWEKLWNENNPKEMMKMYHPEAKIMYGWGRDKGTASKKEYGGILPQRIKANPSINLTITKIDVQGDKAKAAADIKVRGRVTQSTFELIKENDKWLITRFSY
jgi:hypothetical protein